MYLTPDEEAMLRGERGAGVGKAMEILAAIGDIYGAQRLIPIASSQVSGASYKTIGDAGLEFVRDFSSKCKVAVRTTLNPLGMDCETWKEIGVPEKFAKKQLEIVDAYRTMGIEMTATCTPYLIGKSPRMGEHIAWGESSAIAYSNSVIGARTNREGGPSALAAAIVGKTPEYGLHLDENRRAGVIIEVDVRLSGLDYATLGCFVGKAVGKRVPYFKGISGNADELKSLGAAMAASGSVALYHVEGVTPEYRNALDDKLEKMHVGREELDRTREKLNAHKETPELVAIGCPHCSACELHAIAEKLKRLGKGRKRNKNIDLWVCAARQVATSAKDDVEVIKNYGNVVCDTCMVVAPIEAKYKSTGTNSAKAATYLPSPGFCSQKVAYNDTNNLLEMLFV